MLGSKEQACRGRSYVELETYWCESARDCYARTLPAAASVLNLCAHVCVRRVQKHMGGMRVNSPPMNVCMSGICNVGGRKQVKLLGLSSHLVGSGVRHSRVKRGEH